jgi:hypothetical protein
MPRDEVLKLWRQRPFQPFRIKTTARDTFDVKHPESAIIGRRVVAVLLPPPPSFGEWPPTFDLGEAELAWVDVLHIVQIEPLRAIEL